MKLHKNWLSPLSLYKILKLYKIRQRRKYSSCSVMFINEIDFLFGAVGLHTLFVFAENWVILGVFYYPALYYPLLACGTLHNKVGYVLGSLLSWTHFGVLVWQKIDCPKTPLVRNDHFKFTLMYRISLREQQICEESSVSIFSMFIICLGLNDYFND